jgi:hypothetical protein
LRENGKNRGYAAFASHVSCILDINAKSNVRHQRNDRPASQMGGLPEQRYLENFYFGFNPRINRTQVYELAARHFVRQRRDVLLVGPLAQSNPVVTFSTSGLPEKRFQQMRI